MWTTISSVVATLSAFASAVAAVLIWYQIKQAGIQIVHTRKSVEEDHRRSRRERAIELVQGYVSAIEDKMEVNCARKIAQKLNTDQAQHLARGEAFTLHSSSAEWLDRCLGATHVVVGAEVSLDQDAARRLQTRIIQYLNLLEPILLAWKHSIADRDIVALRQKSGREIPGS
jgi:hypothetical protein